MTTEVYSDKVSEQLITGGAVRATIVDRLAALTLVNKEWYDTVTVTEAGVGGVFVQTGAADDGVTTINGFTNILSLGTVMMKGLPTADPLVAGQIWSNLGVLTVSAG